LGLAQSDFQSDVTGAEDELSAAAADANAWEIKDALGHTQGAAAIFFTKNGGTDQALQRVADSINSTISTVRCFVELLSRFTDVEFRYGFSVRFEVAFLEGALTGYWG